MATKKQKLKGLDNAEFAAARQARGVFCGIDPGVRTGVAVWSCEKSGLVDIFTDDAASAMIKVLGYNQAHAGRFTLVIEDARQKRLPRHLQSPARTFGAGSIQRDVKLWTEFCVANQIPFYLKPPVSSLTGWDLEQFGRYTDYWGRTSQHARDAAMLVYDL